MDVVPNHHVIAVWKYIPFAFNQLDIESVEQLSQSIGIKNFQIELVIDLTSKHMN
jgi:hypothetical protein